jgi:hypothetical protein
MMAALFSAAASAVFCTNVLSSLREGDERRLLVVACHHGSLEP